MSKNTPPKVNSAPKKKKKTWPWLIILLAWLLLIIYLSNQPGLNTLPFLYKLKLIPPIENKMLANELEYVVRKLAHITAYAVLYILTFSAVHKMQKKPRTYYSLLGATLFSLVFTLIFAISDEIHQYFVVDRTGRIFDLIIDMFGVFIGQTLLIFFLLLGRKRKKGSTVKK